MQVDLKSSSNFLPALVQQSQEWFDCFAVATAVSNDINGRVTHSVYLRDQLVVSTLQRLL